jgi:cysteine desulfurase
VHHIVGFGKAAELAFSNLEENIEKLKQLERLVKEILVEKFGDQLIFNSDDENKIPGLLSIQLNGVNNERFIQRIADKIAISTGSACSD